MSEIHPALLLLIQRMETNPQEFIGGTKWNVLYNKYSRFFTDEEKAAYEKVLCKIHLDQMHSEVMQELLDPKPEQTKEDINNLLKNYTSRTPSPSMIQEIQRMQYEVEKVRQEQELEKYRREEHESWFKDVLA